MMDEQNNTWAIAELMGHLTLAGRITKPGENGGLWQIDIPDSDGFHTEFFGSQSVYRIRIVSEEIARAYVSKHEILEYAAPIVTREEHQAAIERAQEIISYLRNRVEKLQLALPLGQSEDKIHAEYPDDFEDEEAQF